MQFDDPRNMLEAAAARPSRGVDPHAVIERGRRLRRARYGAAAGGMALVLAGASASFGLLGTRDGGGRRPAAAIDCSRERLTASVFVEPYAMDAAVDALGEELRAHPGVERVTYVTGRQVVEELARLAPALEGLSPEAMPDAFRVEVSDPTVLAEVARMDSAVIAEVVPGGHVACIVRSFCDARPVLAMSIYLRDDATRSSIRRLEQRLAADEGVTEVEFFSKAEAYREFRELYQDRKDLWEGVPPGSLPASFRVVAADADAVERLAAMTSPAIEEIRHSSEMRRRFCSAEADENVRVPAPTPDRRRAAGDRPSTGVDFLGGECTTGPDEIGGVAMFNLADGSKWCTVSIRIENRRDRRARIDPDAQILHTNGGDLTPFDLPDPGLTQDLLQIRLQPGDAVIGELVYLLSPRQIPVAVELRGPAGEPVLFDAHYECPNPLPEVPKRCPFGPP